MRGRLQCAVLIINRAQKYVSPSDEIQSPATQKLSNFRNKNIMKK